MTSAQPQLLVYRLVISGLAKGDGHGRTTQDPPAEGPIASTGPPASVSLGLPQPQSWPAGGHPPCLREVGREDLPRGPGHSGSVGHVSSSAPEPSALSRFDAPWSPGVHPEGIPQHAKQLLESPNHHVPIAPVPGAGLGASAQTRGLLLQAAHGRCPGCGDTARLHLLAGEQNSRAGPGEAPCRPWRRGLWRCPCHCVHFGGDFLSADVHLAEAWHVTVT